MRRHRSSAVPLAWLYGLLIVYASLYPFTEWRAGASGVFEFLAQPWSRYWSRFDIVSNLLGYMPLGALAFAGAVRSGWRAKLALLTACAAGAALSLSMETLQNYLPGRVPSSLDLALNTAGAALGAGLGWAVHSLGGLGQWQALRERWFDDRGGGGIALLVLWPFGLLFPTPVPLGVGQVLGHLREALIDLLEGTSAQDAAQEWLAPDGALVLLSPANEAAAVALGLLAPCLVAFAISRPGWRRLGLVGGAAVLGAAATTLSTALSFAPEHALAWRTPTAEVGLGVGGVLAMLLAWLPWRAAAGLGLAVLAALVALVTQAPTDPYFAQSLQSWEQGRFIRFHGAAQWVGWLWPYAAIVWLLARVSARGER
jgi:VanZ family protein